MKTSHALKRLLVGRPMSSGELEHTLLPKLIALPVFSSDPLSSNAYATQEALIVLAAAGATALSLIIPISIAVACLLAIVVTSYRQTVRAYPSGGGAYRVSRENLGMYAGLTAGSALLIDYVLTVAVSMTAGVDAIVSAAPSLEPAKIEIAFGFIGLVTIANLRGTRESGMLFAVPTYGFVLSVYIMLATGFVRCIGGCPPAESAGLELEAETALTWFIVLKAFAAGTTALTGVEAIADGVQAFRYPQSRNAATTLGIMGFLSISMFLGISWLANHTHVVFAEGSSRTVVAQIAHAIFSGGPMFYVIQIMSAAILILAANTAYQDFPRLSSILAGDSFLPRQLMNRGDRLVYSNGVFILALSAAALVWIFDANLNALIQLYLVGVFVSFSLSQTGMVLHSRKLRPPGWKKTVAISGLGAIVTGVVLVVVVATKFAGGAWIVVSAIPVFVYVMRSIHVHYQDVNEQLKAEERRPAERRPGHQHMVILVNRVDAAAAHAVGYMRSIRPNTSRAITFDNSCHGPWMRLAPEIPLTTIEPGRSAAQRVRNHLKGLRAQLQPDDFLTLVVPEVLHTRSLFEVLRRPATHRLKAALLFEPGIQVLDIPLVDEDIQPGKDPSHELARNHVVVLVSRVNNATLHAIEYAETLRPTTIRGVTFGLEFTETETIGDAWLEAMIPHPLEIEDSPFRDVGSALTSYVKQFGADGIDRVVTVVIPEFVVPHKRHQILHGQTALIAKRHLLFMRGVVVVSVPYHLEEKSRIARPAMETPPP